jgi:hypothetical protein
MGPVCPWAWSWLLFWAGCWPWGAAAAVLFIVVGGAADISLGVCSGCLQTGFCKGGKSEIHKLLDKQTESICLRLKMECFYQVYELVYEISGKFYLNSIHSPSRKEGEIMQHFINYSKLCMKRG